MTIMTINDPNYAPLFPFSVLMTHYAYMPHAPFSYYDSLCPLCLLTLCPYFKFFPLMTAYDSLSELVANVRLKLRNIVRYLELQYPLPIISTLLHSSLLIVFSHYR